MHARLRRERRRGRSRKSMTALHMSGRRRRGTRRRVVGVAGSRSPPSKRQNCPVRPRTIPSPGTSSRTTPGSSPPTNGFVGVPVRPPEPAQPPERPGERDVRDRDGAQRLVDARGGRVDRERVALGELVHRQEVVERPHGSIDLPVRVLTQRHLVAAERPEVAHRGPRDASRVDALVPLTCPVVRRPARPRQSSP